jgi:hypothetical protein
VDQRPARKRQDRGGLRSDGFAVHHFALLAEPATVRRQTVAQVADAIASSAGLAITPSADGPLRASLRRYATTVRHIRFG